MKVETLRVAGIEEAVHAMRNPMNSWGKNDTKDNVGPNDRTLSERLQKAGPEHCKHLRMINVWADIEAPRFWEIELDTYRIGVEKVSCSTMHKLLSRHLELSDFVYSSNNTMVVDTLIDTIDAINSMMDLYKSIDNEEKKKFIWRGIIELLPQSYIQKRTYMFSYAALRNIVRQRKGHKLYEWKQFIDWVHTLPESWMIFDEDVPE